MVTLSPRTLLQLERALNLRLRPMGVRTKLWISPTGIRVSSWRVPPG